MKIFSLIILSSLSFSFLFGWEGEQIKFGAPINCNYFKNSSTSDENNPGYQKCIIYKSTFDKYAPFVQHYNEKNKRGEKYTLKFHNIYSEYKFKKYIYDNLDRKKYPINSPTHNKYKWEYSSLKEVYDNIEIKEPKIVSNYRSELSNWRLNGEGNNVSNEEMLELHRKLKLLTKRSLKSKYQYQLNGLYTSLVEVEHELSRRNLLYTTINTLFEF